MEKTITEIKERIRSAISKQHVGRDNIDQGMLEGLAAGLYFFKLLEQSGSAMNFSKENEKIARGLGVKLEEIDLSNLAIALPDEA
jgi:hypothetical protein